MSNKNSTGGASGGTNVPADEVVRRDLKQRVVRIITDMVHKVLENMRRGSSLLPYAFDLDVDYEEFKFIKRHAVEAKAIELDSGVSAELVFYSFSSFIKFLDSIENRRWTRGGGGEYSGPSLEISSHHPFKIQRNSGQLNSARVTHHVTKGW